jgi:hypothetical protein
VDGRVAGRVPRPHDEDVLARHGLGFGSGRPVEHSRADQRLQVRHAQAAPGDVGRYQSRAGRDCGAGGDFHQAVGPTDLQASDLLGEDQVCAEQPRLLERPVGELVAADPARESQGRCGSAGCAGLATDNLCLISWPSRKRSIRRMLRATPPSASDDLYVVRAVITSPGVVVRGAAEPGCATHRVHCPILVDQDDVLRDITVNI